VEKRLLVTIVVCLGVMILWSTVVAPLITPPPPPKPPESQEPAPKEKPKAEEPKKEETEKEKPGAGEEKTPEPGKEGEPPAKPGEFTHEDAPPHEKTIENGLLRVTLSSRGATVADLRLLEFDSAWADEPEQKAQVMAAWDPKRGHFALKEIDGDEDPILKNWKLEEEGENFVEYSYLHPRGIRIRKRFELVAEKYLLLFTLSLENLRAEGQAIRLRLVPIDGVVSDSVFWHQRYTQGFVGERRKDDTNTSPDYVKPQDLMALEKEKETEKDREAERRRVNQSRATADLKWIGAKNRYFAAIFIPKSSEAQGALSRYRFRPLSETAFYGGGRQIPGIVCEADTAEIGLGADPKSFEYVLFTGPVQPDTLQHAPNDLSYLYEPLGNDVLAGIVLGLLTFFYSIFGNYGVAIIFTTLLIRLCLFPLTRKAQVSSFKMQALQPRVKTLKERYKDDPQKMNKEMMKLWRQEGVSPLSGCLPMLLQLPVFIAMFAVYNQSIELRQAPFFLWITDLSQPDRLIGPFDRPIPLVLFSIWEINILPLIMMVTWFLQSYFMPKSPDPQMQTQQKMMMILPLTIGLLFYYYASGLSLYFFINSLLALIEQKLIKKFFLKPAGSAEPK
jgi:YidC/Oxa1 family membrane protein insertase